ncbi:MAG: hypothetical protein AB7N90_14585, partial [Vicinamibacterales bacterium]
MTRMPARLFPLLAGALVLAGCSQPAPAPAPAPAPFDVVEATIPEMRQAMEEGRVTSHDLVLQ